MSKKILGLSGLYHDSAAAIIIDGEIIAAAQEERFTRKKHDPRFPENAINYCLEEAFVESSELDAVVFYDNPLLTLDRVIKSLIMVSPNGEEQWHNAAKSILGVKLFVSDYIKKALQTDVNILFTEHHAAHGASAFYPSPFKDAAILTMDGVGEWATTTIGVGRSEDMQILKRINYPHSVGLLYSAFTYYCGFKVNSGEYKLMGLAPYGTPKYVDRIKENLIHILADGSFRLNMDYFAFLTSNYMINEKFEKLFGATTRKPETQITRHQMDIAASIQKVTEEIIIKCARHTRELTGMKQLVMAGGVALNCVANGKLVKENFFDDIWIQPAAGDAGGALGAALLVSHMKFKVPRPLNASRNNSQKCSFLGPAFNSNEIWAFLDHKGYPHKRIKDKQERIETIAKALSDGMVVGYFSGRMEFGPRALGARSILGDPRNVEMQVTMNLKIKYRESFRPFAPVVLEERCEEYFELDCESPYMLLVAPVQKERRFFLKNHLKRESENLLEIVREKRSDIPAVTHVNYSARVQTVRREDNQDFYDLIKDFERLTGVAVLINTSFNVRGEPIVCSVEDAYRCFMRTEIDMLVVEDYILLKKDQPKIIKNDSWKQEYELD